VETPYDALQCFLYSFIDCIYLERFKINRPSPLYLFLSLSPGWRMSVKLEADTNRHVISIVNGAGTKTVELEGPDQMVKLFRHLDGFKSLANAYQDAFEDNLEPAESNSLVAIIPAFQHLVRQGALQMRVGDLVFKEFVDELHWWQVPQIKS